MISHISDTARWVAYYRAMETMRPDAIFKDPFAERLAGPEGKKIVETLKQGRRMAWAMIVRTAVFDELIYEAVRGKQVDLVVNLAAGLDARPWRMDLPPNLRWVDVDLPGILDYKLEQLKGEKTKCRYEAIRVDLTDGAKRQAVLSQLGASTTRALIVTEGLLIYLTDQQAGALATDLHAQPTFRWWVFDIAHPRLLKMMEKMWGHEVHKGRAPFLFAPEENTKFFEKFGWREASYRGNMEEAKRLNRQMAGMWFWAFIARFYPRHIREAFKRFSGIALMERV